MVSAGAGAAREQAMGHKDGGGLCVIDALLLTLNCAKNEVDWIEAMESMVSESEWVARRFPAAFRLASGRFRGLGRTLGIRSGGAGCP